MKELSAEKPSRLSLESERFVLSRGVDSPAANESVDALDKESRDKSAPCRWVLAPSYELIGLACEAAAEVDGVC